MATARPKISLKIRVLRDEKTAGDWGKLFDESVNVQLVIDWSMEKAAAQTQSRLEFQPPLPPAPQPTNPQGRARRPMHRWHSAHCARSWALSHHVPGCARRVDTTLPYIAVTDV